RPALAGDESTVRGERLREAAHHDVDLAQHVLHADVTAAILAECAEIMRDVDDERGVVFVTQRLEGREIRSVRIHREQALGYDQNAVLAVFGPDLGEDVAAVVVVEMPEQMNVVGRGMRAFLQAGMRQHVYYDVISRPDEALDHSEAGSPAGWIKHDMVHVEKFRDLALKRHRMRSVADQRRRSGAVDTATLDRFNGRSHDIGMRGEAEIVLRGEVDAVHPVAPVVLRGANGLGSIFGRARERPEAVLPAQVLPAEESLGAAQKVSSARNTEISHAARQRSRRHTAVGSV